MAQLNAGGIRFTEQRPEAPLPVLENAPDLAGGAPLIGPAARIYRKYYSERGHVPPPERIAGCLAGYCFADGGGGVVPTRPAALRDQTVTLSDGQPMTFLCLITGTEGHGEVSILHRFVRYMDIPRDDPSTGYNDRVLGLIGDSILSHQYPVVEIPNIAFHLVGTAVVRVPTHAAMNALIATWDDPTTALGPYTDQDPETEVVRPRNLQLIPGCLAALLIHRRRVRAKDAYLELAGAIQAEGALEAYGDVITWL